VGGDITRRNFFIERGKISNKFQRYRREGKRREIHIFAEKKGGI